MADPRKKFRRAIAYGLYYSGLLWLVARIKWHRKAVVLMYHRVLPPGSDTFSEDAIVVKPETFARQMKFLKRWLRPLSTQQLADLMEKRQPLPSMSCVVTFDDGWADNFEHALPILRAQQMPATIYVATDYIGTQNCFWQERLARLMTQAIAADGEARTLVERETQPDIAKLSPRERQRAVRNAVTQIKRWPASQIDGFEKAIRSALEADGRLKNETGVDRFMSWGQVAELPRNSHVSVGSHGCSHTPLVALAPDDAATELRAARERIQARGGGGAESIAYPNGDHDDHVIAMAREAGYRIGFTTDKGVVSSDDDPLRLRRINVHEAASQTMPEFLCAMLLIFHRLRRAPPAAVHARSRY